MKKILVGVTIVRKVRIVFLTLIRITEDFIPTENSINYEFKLLFKVIKIIVVKCFKVFRVNIILLLNNKGFF